MDSLCTHELTHRDGKVPQYLMSSFGSMAMKTNTYFTMNSALSFEPGSFPELVVLRANPPHCAVQLVSGSARGSVAAGMRPALHTAVFALDYMNPAPVWGPCPCVGTLPLHGNPDLLWDLTQWVTVSVVTCFSPSLPGDIATSYSLTKASCKEKIMKE